MVAQLVLNEGPKKKMTGRLKTKPRELQYFMDADREGSRGRSLINASSEEMAGTTGREHREKC